MATLVTNTRTNRSWDNGDFVCLPDMGFDTFEMNEASYDDAIVIAQNTDGASRRATAEMYVRRLGLNTRQANAFYVFAECSTMDESVAHQEAQLTLLGVTEQPRDLDKAEVEWRKLPEEQQPHLVVFMGMLGYEVLAVCATEAEAEEVLAAWTVCAVIGALAQNPSHNSPSKYGNGLKLPGYTRCVWPQDLQVRTPASLDRLTAAILSSYR